MQLPHYFLNERGNILTKWINGKKREILLSNLETIQQQRAKIALIDRDGVMIHKAPKLRYHTSLKDIIILPDVAKAITYLNKKNISIVVITNQPGIYKKLISINDLYEMDLEMLRQLRKYKGKIDSVFFCPHAAYDEGDKITNDKLCTCRKPHPGMLNTAMLLYGVEGGNTFMFGDFESDIQAAKNAGVNPIYITTKHDEYEEMKKRIEIKHPEVLKKSTFNHLFDAV